MARLIMWNLVSLDGYFEGSKSWDLEWFQSYLEDNFFSFSLQLLRSADMLLFGRVTYEGMERYWCNATGEIADLMNQLPKVVFSRTLERVDWSNTTLVKTDPTAAVRELKSRLQKDIFVFGSADLSRTLMRAGCFDEYRLAIMSVVLGGGRRLFYEHDAPVSLRIVDSQRLSPACVVLRYEPAKNQ